MGESFWFAHFSCIPTWFYDGLHTLCIWGEVWSEWNDAVEFAEIYHNFEFSFKLDYKITKKSSVKGYFYTYKGLFCANCYIIALIIDQTNLPLVTGASPFREYKVWSLLLYASLVDVRQTGFFGKLLCFLFLGVATSIWLVSPVILEDFSLVSTK